MLPHELSSSSGGGVAGAVSLDTTGEAEVAVQIPLPGMVMALTLLWMVVAVSEVLFQLAD